MSASLSDILTAAKNIVTALNNASQTYLNVNGARSSCNISAATVVSSSSGRCVSVIVTTAGSTTGSVYDSISTSNTTLSVFVIPNTVGVFTVNCPVTNGIVVAPGSGQIVTVVYS